jgi:hypothetical protein
MTGELTAYWCDDCHTVTWESPGGVCGWCGKDVLTNPKIVHLCRSCRIEPRDEGSLLCTRCRAKKKLSAGYCACGHKAMGQGYNQCVTCYTDDLWGDAEAGPVLPSAEEEMDVIKVGSQ